MVLLLSRFFMLTIEQAQYLGAFRVLPPETQKAIIKQAVADQLDGGSRAPRSAAPSRRPVLKTPVSNICYG